MTFVFDLDGTIIDSSKRHWVLMGKLLKEHSIMVSNDFPQDYMQYKADGHTGMDYLTYLLNLDEKTAEDIYNKWRSHIEDEEYLELDELYDDAQATLNGIGNKIMFVTAREREDGLKRELVRLGLDKYEVKIVNHGTKKSAILSEIGKCLIVGDTEVDYQAATELGCEAYILNRGFRSKAFWDKKGVSSKTSLSQLLEEVT